MQFVADIETNGLLHELTKVHSLVLRNLESGAVLSYADQPGYTPIEKGLEQLARADKSYWHNGIHFDIPALRKVYPRWTITEDRIRDTLIIARMRWAHIKDTDYDRVRRKRLPGKLVGSHSLEAWGYRLGVYKGEFGKTTDWSEWTPDMQTYCEQDTEVGRALVVRIRQAGVSPQSVETEHELAWYLAAQQRNGVPFDKERAVTLHSRLAARREELANGLREEFGSWLARDKTFIPKRDDKVRGYVAGAEVTKLKWVQFNPASRDHIANRLTRLYGWQPTEFTETGKPAVDETTLKGLEFPAAKALNEYLLVDKRLGQLSEGKQAWLRCVTEAGTDGGKVTGLEHIHGSINQNGCVTHRASHSYPNLGQVPKVTSEYGPECRELFYVPAGWQLMGADASGLELRCLAHYMARYDGGAYRDVILNGDVHAVNRDALGLSGKEGRDIAKTFIYAFLYGAGDEKIGSIILPLGTPKQQQAAGKALRAKFLKGLPAMRYLTESVRAKAKSQGYLQLIDGRRAYVRSEHAALNTLLQGTGAVICKRWLVEFNRRMLVSFGPQGWRHDWAALLWVHDEIQVAVRQIIAEAVARIAVEAITAMTDHFAFRCPLTGEAGLGANWRETH